MTLVIFSAQLHFADSINSVLYRRLKSAHRIGQHRLSFTKKVQYISIVASRITPPYSVFSRMLNWGGGVNRVSEGGQCSSFIVNGITVM